MAYVDLGTRLQASVSVVEKGREATKHSWASGTTGTSVIEPRVRGLDALSFPHRVQKVVLPGQLRTNGTYRDMSAPYNPTRGG